MEARIGYLTEDYVYFSGTVVDLTHEAGTEVYELSEPLATPGDIIVTTKPGDFEYAFSVPSSLVRWAGVVDDFENVKTRVMEAHRGRNE